MTLTHSFTKCFFANVYKCLNYYRYCKFYVSYKIEKIEIEKFTVTTYIQ
jgi:hypothetical protein